MGWEFVWGELLRRVVEVEYGSGDGGGLSAG